MTGHGVDVMLVERVVAVGRSHHLFVLDAVVTGVALELGHLFTVVVRVVLQRHPSNMAHGWEESHQTWRTGGKRAIKHGARVGRQRKEAAGRGKS